MITTKLINRTDRGTGGLCRPARRLRIRLHHNAGFWDGQGGGHLGSVGREL